MSSDPILVQRTQSPPIEIYEEGKAPSKRETKERDALIDPHMAFEAMNDFLESLQQQWLEYGYGPKGFDNHGVNPGVHHAEERERYRWALATKSVSRMTTLDVKPMFKREDTIPQFWPGMPVRRENPPVERTDALGQRDGFAPNMPDCPAYFLRQDLDIIQQMFGNEQGAAVLHQMARDHTIAARNAAAGNRDNTPGENNRIGMVDYQYGRSEYGEETSMVKVSQGAVPLMVALQEEDHQVVKILKRRTKMVLEDMGELP
ncbi:hypothetical protein PISMIDRAFT_14368 [Pisolithus microcarpus 441]|uniref:Uncharacterized protein n=1 Tax=Pisolithus microcarpus 441 TaxID=765257 RepID=A0A0C9YPA9_9AGAM|nr:hypothetical protein PISMIDRAFT_14368 [Pisolithus microcarpus 441]